MRKLRENMAVRRLGITSFDEWARRVPECVGVHGEFLHPATSFGASHLEHYTLEVRLAVNFAARDETFEDSKENAGRLLVRGVYQDLLTHLQRIRGACWSGSRDELLKVVDEIEKDLLP